MTTRPDEAHGVPKSITRTIYIPNVIGQGIGRKIEWVQKRYDRPTYSREYFLSTFKTIEERLGDIGSLSAKEREAAQTNLRILKDIAIQHIEEEGAGRGDRDREIQNITTTFERILRNISGSQSLSPPEQPSIEKDALSKRLETLNTRLHSLAASCPSTKRLDFDRLVETGKILDGALKDKEVQTIQEEVPAFEEKIAQFEMSVLLDKYSSALERLRGLSGTLPLDSKQEYEQLKLEGQSLLPPDSINPQKIQAFESKVETLEHKVLKSLQDDLGITEDIAKQIFTAGQTGWESLIIRLPNGAIQQNHTIKGLKIYADDSGLLVADFAKDTIGTGTYKRAKRVQRLGGQAYVRLTSRSKDIRPQQELAATLPSQKAAQKLQELTQWFTDDIQSEAWARHHLAGIPNITGMTHIRYISRKTGQWKIRYIMTKYEGDLDGLTRDPLSTANRNKALQCCKGVFQCIRAMHAAQWVHGDLKMANVLFRDDQGYVSDFGLLSRQGMDLTYIGNLVYMAPETVFGPRTTQFGPEMDMYSLGILLLGVANRTRYLQWCSQMNALQTNYSSQQRDYNDMKSQLESLQYQLAQQKATNPTASTTNLEQKILSQEAQLDRFRQSFISTYRKEYKALHDQLQRESAKNGDALSLLIRDLMHYDPNQRLTCADAQIRFLEALKTQPSP